MRTKMLTAPELERIRKLVDDAELLAGKVREVAHQEKDDERRNNVLRVQASKIEEAGREIAELYT